MLAGTGIGSSSTFTVCLLHALHTYKREYVSRDELAEEACEIEIEILKEPIGKQDQYAASYGGFNKIMFRPDGAVVVEPVICARQVKDELEKCLLLFYVGNNRLASGILSEQKANMAQQDKFRTVEQMVDLAEQMRQCLADENLTGFGELMHKAWLLKRQVASGITNSAVDRFYEKDLKAGALGGKLLGALAAAASSWFSANRKTSTGSEIRWGFEKCGLRLRMKVQG